MPKTRVEMLNETTLRVTIAGETRDVEVGNPRKDGSLLVSTRAVGMFQKGAGREWAQRLDFWRQLDGSYRLSTTATILNRCAYSLRGWATAIKNESQHNSAWGVPAATQDIGTVNLAGGNVALEVRSEAR